MGKQAVASCRNCGKSFTYVQVTSARSRCDECARRVTTKVRAEELLQCFSCGESYRGDKTSTRCQTCQRAHANEMRRRREGAGPDGAYEAEFRCASCGQVFTYEKRSGTRSSRRKCDACKLRDSRLTAAARLGPLREAFAYAERPCAHCERLFQPSNVAHKYCSAACNAAAARRRKRDGTSEPLPNSRPCVTCRTEFQPKSGRNVYCSPACRPARIGKEVVASAEIAGRLVEVSRDRANQMARDFGLSAEAYLNLWREQKGRCAICDDPFPDSPHPSIDHDAETLTVRGLLCFNCNIGIGYLKHSVEALRAAVRFIESPPAKFTMTSYRKPPA